MSKEHNDSHTSVPTVVPEEVSEGGGRYSQSLSSGLSILTSFDGESSRLGIAELAGRLGMSRSTAHRYAATLAALGYLEQDAGRQYRLTPRAADPGLAALSAMEVRTRSRAPLAELRAWTGRTVSIAILYDTEIMLMERLRGWRAGLLEIDLRLGAASRLPAYCTAMGKVMLAHLPRAAYEERLTRLAIEPRGPNCVATGEDLDARLKQARSDGFAIDEEELTAEMCSVAVPVLDDFGMPLAAIDLALPSNICTVDQLTALAMPLRATAKRIAAAMQIE